MIYNEVKCWTWDRVEREKSYNIKMRTTVTVKVKASIISVQFCLSLSSSC